jgi:hypothetical protein
MKYIKQISTNKIVYRESPYTDKTLANAVMDTGITKSDLEVVDSTLTDDEWNSALHDQLSYSDKRKEEYDKLNQFELIGEDSINGTTNHKDAILRIKAKYPKP